MSVTFGAFTPGTYQDIIGSIRQSLQIYGASYYVDPVNGSDTFVGTSPTQAYRTLPQAYAACTKRPARKLAASSLKASAAWKPTQRATWCSSPRTGGAHTTAR